MAEVTDATPQDAPVEGLDESVVQDASRPAAPEDVFDAPAGQEPEAPEGAEEGSAPDINEQIAALRTDVQALRQGEQPPEDADLYERLAGYSEEDAGYDAEEDGQGQRVQVDPFEQMVRERVAEAMYPVQMGIEQDRRRQALEGIASDHPELRTPEMQEAIADRLEPLAQRYGNEMILTDPDLILQNLLAIKAERATASEVPAEQAAQRGQGIERATGASAPEAPESAEDAIRKGILGASNAGSAFV
jgi:hypothetical protein